MMRNTVAAVVLLGAIHLATTAFAEGGYYSGILGTRAAGRGGAVTASVADVTAVSANPAGLSKIDANMVQVGNTLSYNSIEFTREAKDPSNIDPQTGQPRQASFAKVRNAVPWQGLDPFLGFASSFGRKDWAFALAAYAPPGISRIEFPQDGGQRYMMVSRQAMILKYVASAAWKYHDVLGIGAAAEWIHVPSLKYSLFIDGTRFSDKANPISSSYDILANVSGASLFTFNAVLGAWYRPAPFLEIALSGQVVPADIVAKSTLSVTLPTGSSLGDVKLSRARLPANDVSITLPLPMLFRSGIRYRHLSGNAETFDLELDLEYQTWSRVNQFTIETNGLQAKSTSDPLPIDLGTISIDKHWRDTVAVRLGGDYAAIPSRLTLRAGGYYESAVADAAYSNVDFSAGAQVGGGVGASVFLGRWELVLAYHLRVQPSVYTSESNARVYQQVPGGECKAPYTSTADCDPYYLGQPSPAVNAGTYSATSHFWAIEVLYRH
jgi:long-subunit fatty acid transport protein